MNNPNLAGACVLEASETLYSPFPPKYKKPRYLVVSCVAVSLGGFFYKQASKYKLLIGRVINVSLKTVEIVKNLSVV